MITISINIALPSVNYCVQEACSEDIGETTKPDANEPNTYQPTSNSCGPMSCSRLNILETLTDHSEPAIMPTFEECPPVITANPGSDMGICFQPSINLSALANESFDDIADEYNVDKSSVYFVENGSVVERSMDDPLHESDLHLTDSELELPSIIVPESESDSQKKEDKEIVSEEDTQELREGQVHNGFLIVNPQRFRYMRIAVVTSQDEIMKKICRYCRPIFQDNSWVCEFEVFNMSNYKTPLWERNYHLCICDRSLFRRITLSYPRVICSFFDLPCEWVYY